MGVGDDCDSLRSPSAQGRPIRDRRSSPRVDRLKTRTTSARKADGLVGVQAPLRTRETTDEAFWTPARSHRQHSPSPQRTAGCWGNAPPKNYPAVMLSRLGSSREGIGSRTKNCLLLISACRGKLVPVPLPLAIRGLRALASQPSRVLRAGELTASLLPNAMRVSFPGRHGRMPPSPSLVAQPSGGVEGAR